MSDCGDLERRGSWKSRAVRAVRRLKRRLIMELSENDDNCTNHDSRFGSTGSRQLMLANNGGGAGDEDNVQEINERSCTPPPPYTEHTMLPSAAAESAPESAPVLEPGCLSHVSVQPLSPPPYTEPLPAAPVPTIQVMSTLLPPPPAYTGPAPQDPDSTASFHDFTRSTDFRGNGYDPSAVATINQPEPLSEQSFDPHCILACIAFWCGGCVLGLVSMIFVITAREKVRTSPESAKRFACASLCLSLCSILLIVLTVTVVPITLAYVNRKTD